MILQDVAALDLTETEFDRQLSAYEQHLYRSHTLPRHHQRPPKPGGAPASPYNPGGRETGGSPATHGVHQPARRLR